MTFVVLLPAVSLRKLLKMTTTCTWAQLNGTAVGRPIDFEEAKVKGLLNH